MLPQGAVFVIAHSLAVSKKAEGAHKRCGVQSGWWGAAQGVGGGGRCVWQVCVLEACHTLPNTQHTYPHKSVVGHLQTCCFDCD